MQYIFIYIYSTNETTLMHHGWGLPPNDKVTYISSLT